MSPRGSVAAIEGSAAVTIIVVSYQTCELLRRCLASLSDEVECGFASVVVVDNGSTDSSPEVVRDEFPWSELITGFGNVGFGAAVNLGARGRDTPWLVAANADVELRPGALRNLTEIAEQHPDAGVFAPRLVLPSGETQQSVYRFPRASDRLISISGAHRWSNALARRVDLASSWSPVSGEVDWAAGAFLLLRTEAFQAVGGFDETQWMYSEDMDICWRLARQRWGTRYVATAIVHHHAESAVGVAFGARSQTLKLAAHYAWLERRFGSPVMLADAAGERVGVSLRRAILWPLQRWRPERWSDAYDRVGRWRAMTVEALRIRDTMRACGTAPNALASAALEWPRDGLEAVERCPLCRSTRRQTLYSDLTDRMARPARGRWKISQCLDCVTAYLDPRPTQSTIALAYGRGYYTHRPRPSSAPGLRSHLRMRVRHGYLNRSLGYELTPASPVGGALLSLFRRRAEVSASSVRHLPFRRGGRILDVGAGAGNFVALMRAAGWDAEGIDSDPAAADAAQVANVPVRCATVDQLLAEGNEHAFDAITLNHVIEHLHDPREALEVCGRLLKRRGVLWIATPNLDGAGHRRFGRHWVHLDPPRHLVLFTRGSLKSLLGSAGFVDVRGVMTRSTRPTWSFRASAAIARGETPSAGRRTVAALRMVGLARLALRLHPSRTEEIAMIARPADDERASRFSGGGSLPQSVPGRP